MERLYILGKVAHSLFHEKLLCSVVKDMDYLYDYRKILWFYLWVKTYQLNASYMSATVLRALLPVLMGQQTIKQVRYLWGEQRERQLSCPMEGRGDHRRLPDGCNLEAETWRTRDGQAGRKGGIRENEGSFRPRHSLCEREKKNICVSGKWWERNMMEAGKGGNVSLNEGKNCG